MRVSMPRMSLSNVGPGFGRLNTPSPAAGLHSNVLYVLVQKVAGYISCMYLFCEMRSDE